MQALSVNHLKSVYAKLMGALFLSLLLLAAGYFFLYQHQQKNLEKIAQNQTLEFTKSFKEFLYFRALPLEGYLQSAAFFEDTKGRVEAMWDVWMRASMGMEGVGYDAVLLLDRTRLPLASLSLIEGVGEKELLGVIPVESLSLEYPIFVRSFVKLQGKESKERVIELFSSPIRSSSGGEIQGYLVAFKLWNDTEISSLDRLSSHQIHLLLEGDDSRGYDLFYPLQDFYGREVARVGVVLDKSLALTIDRIFLFQIAFVSSAGLLASLGILALLFVLVLRPLRQLSKVLQEKDKATLKELLYKEDEFGEISRVVQRFFKQNAILEQYKGAIDASFIVSKGDLLGNITYANDQFCQVSGYKREELLGRNHNIVRHPDNTREFFAALWKRISSGRIWSGVIKNRNKRGGDYYVRAVIVPLMNDEGEIEEYLSIRTDITELYEQMQMIIKQTTDLLTGLPNKQQLLHDLESPLSHCLLFVNINRFRGVNDSFGHEAGDSLLVEFANRLGALLPMGATLYRLGGDEFAILLEEGKGEIEKLSRDIFATLEETPFIVAGTEIILSARISSACGVELLYQKCDMAMNYAKINNLSFVDFDRNGQIREELERSKMITRMIQEAIRSDFIQAYGQKIVSVKEPNLYKIETLMRIVDGSGKITSPFIFLEQAKNSRLYSRLTRIMIKKVFESFKGNALEFSINLTFEDILDHETTRFILDSIQSMGLQNRVTIELVESEEIGASPEMELFIKEAKALGCKISIDDFGSGYSNFDYILKIGADFIKIDGSLIKNIDTDKNSYITVKTIIALAKELGIGVVAEYIHSKEVMEVVVELGVDYLQGYYLHEPQKLDVLLA